MDRYRYQYRATDNTSSSLRLFLILQNFYLVKASDSVVLMSLSDRQNKSFKLAKFKSLMVS